MAEFKRQYKDKPEPDALDKFSALSYLDVGL